MSQALCRKGFFHFAVNAKAEPLLKAIKEPRGILAHARVDFIFGQTTWLDTEVARETAAAIGPRSSLVIIPDAGTRLPATSPKDAHASGTLTKSATPPAPWQQSGMRRLTRGVTPREEPRPCWMHASTVVESDLPLRVYGFIGCRHACPMKDRVCGEVWRAWPRDSCPTCAGTS